MLQWQSSLDIPCMNKTSVCLAKKCQDDQLRRAGQEGSDRFAPQLFQLQSSNNFVK